jgi:hypothetical protein
MRSKVKQLCLPVIDFDDGKIIERQCAEKQHNANYERRASKVRLTDISHRIRTQPEAGSCGIGRVRSMARDSICYRRLLDNAGKRM